MIQFLPNQMCMLFIAKHRTWEHTLFSFGIRRKWLTMRDDANLFKDFFSSKITFYLVKTNWESNFSGKHQFFGTYTANILTVENTTFRGVMFLDTYLILPCKHLQSREIRIENQLTTHLKLWSECRQISHAKRWD